MNFREKIGENDAFWGIEELVPPTKKKKGAFASDVEAVTVSVSSGDEPIGEKVPPRPLISPSYAAEKKTAKTTVDIPPFEDPRKSRTDTGGSTAGDRLAKAREALLSVQKKIDLKSAAAFSDRGVNPELTGETVSVPLHSDDRKKEPEGESVPVCHRMASEADDDAVDKEYVPDWNQLITNVKIAPWPARYSFYEHFKRDALRYYEYEGTPCPSEPFFSFSPQYAQLSAKQKSYYFYWRSAFRRGECLEADYAYLLLFIYEVINLPDKIPPLEGVRLLLRLWESYRRTYRKLNRVMAEWVCDYCLIGQIEPPAELLLPLRDEVLITSSLREFYVGSTAGGGKVKTTPIAAMLLLCAGYDYRSSKFISAENRQFFQTHIEGAFCAAFSRMEKEQQLIFSPQSTGKPALTTVTTVRDGYNGALCAYDVKKKISVTHIVCSRSVELRLMLTDAVKYAENHVRHLLGIRSRFHTAGLPAPLKNAIDDYFAPLRQKKACEQEDKKRIKKAEIPAYEHLYEPIHRDFSVDLAKSIEKEAWQITDRLTETEDQNNGENADETVEPLKPAEESSSAVEEKQRNEEYSDAELLIRQALAALLAGNKTAFCEAASGANRLPAALCEEINDLLYDTIGDTVVEETDGGFALVEDYREEITAWMNR